jgi:hypothetical protein
MRIETAQRLLRGVAPREAENAESLPSKNGEKAAETVHGDRLELSLPARLTSSFLEEVSQESCESGEIGPERTAQIQDRIGLGFYNSPAALEDTAKEILSFYSHSRK